MKIINIICWLMPIRLRVRLFSLRLFFLDWAPLIVQDKWLRNSLFVFLLILVLFLGCLFEMFSLITYNHQIFFIPYTFMGLFMFDILYVLLPIKLFFWNIFLNETILKIFSKIHLRSLGMKNLFQKDM